MSQTNNGGFPPPMRSGNGQGQSSGFPAPQRRAAEPSGDPNQGAPPPARPQQEAQPAPQHPQRPPQPPQQGGGFPAPQRQNPAPASPPSNSAPPVRRSPASNPGPVPEGGGSGDLFEQISRSRKKVVRPEGGLRGAIYTLTNGRVNPGLSKVEAQIADLIEAVQTPIYGEVKHIAIWSQKGGVGKTTTATRVGVTLAKNRTDHVLALDVNPDGGSLAVRVPRTTKRHILNLRDALRSAYVSPADFDQFVNHAPHRLNSIVMPPGKKPKTPLTGNDYLMIAKALQERYPYKFIVTDCGTNLSDSVMDGVLRMADQLVVVTPTTVDEATVTAGGLEALIDEGYGNLVSNAVTALVEKSPRDPNVDVQRRVDESAQTIRNHFERLTRKVVSMPYDSRIFLGDVFDPGAISQDSQIAELELTKEIVLGLAERGR